MLTKERLRTVLEDIAKTGTLNDTLLNDLSPEETALIISLYEKQMVGESLQFLNSLDEDGDWETLKQRMVVPRERKIPLWKNMLRYAAVLAGLFLMGYLFKTVMVDTPEPLPVDDITLKVGEEDIEVINQGDNRQIVVSNAVIGIQKGNTISHTSGTEIKELIYNELSVPHGRVFNLEMSDGTMVHLNAGTKIRYPIAFLEGSNREVFIDGEAYFKVSRDENHPFIVHADAVSVEVLGTEFNISSYAEDAEVNTVLVEGAVRMRTGMTPDQHTDLTPGLMGSWDKTSHSIVTEKVELGLYVGWVEGELIFRKSSFENMAKKLERRYNVTIQNNNALLDSKKFNARFNVNVESIDDIMKSVSGIYPFSYTIGDGKVIIE
ncbi:MAG: FecR family protein [Flavobacteriaceae bacterium]